MKYTKTKRPTHMDILSAAASQEVDRNISDAARARRKRRAGLLQGMRQRSAERKVFERFLIEYAIKDKMEGFESLLLNTYGNIGILPEILHELKLELFMLEVPAKEGCMLASEKHPLEFFNCVESET